MRNSRRAPLAIIIVLILSAFPAMKTLLLAAEYPLLEANSAADAAPGTVATPPAIVLGGNEVSGILGREVRTVAGEKMGRIVDAIVDRNGQIRAAIIDFGGFLGVGSRKIAVDWNSFYFRSEDQDHIVLQLTRQQAKDAPEYREGKPVVVLSSVQPRNSTIPE